MINKFEAQKYELNSDIKIKTTLQTIGCVDANLYCQFGRKEERFKTVPAVAQHLNQDQ